MDGSNHYRRTARLASNLRKERRKGESMRAFAHRIGVPRSTINDILLRGVIPRVGTLLWIERVLAVKEER